MAPNVAKKRSSTTAEDNILTQQDRRQKTSPSDKTTPATEKQNEQAKNKKQAESLHFSLQFLHTFVGTIQKANDGKLTDKAELELVGNMLPVYEALKKQHAGHDGCIDDDD